MNESRISKVSNVIIAAAFLFMSLFVLRASVERVLTLMPDDAAYYFKIAENASAGGGLTFDGINRTNGFQPLWLAVLVPVYRAYHGAPETMCRIVLVLQLAILALAALLLNAALARFFSRRTVLVSLLLFLFVVFVSAANGMESAILVLFLALAFYAGVRMEVFGLHDPKREFLFGILLGLVVLSRLDMIFLPLVVVVASFGRARFVRTLCIGAGVAAVVLPYLVFNQLSFGAVMPISGLLKSSFPRLSDPSYALSTLGKWGLAGLLLAAVYAAYALARFRSRRSGADGRGYYGSAMTAMACAILLHFVHALFFMKWAVFSWHYVPYVFFGAVAVCEPVERLLAPAGVKRPRAMYWIAVAAIVLVGCTAVFRGLSRPFAGDWRIAAYSAARWARENTGTDAVFAMKDAGNFAYFSERRVVNLDGVVNNLEYQAALKEKNLRGYLAIKGVDFIVQHAFWDRPDVTKGEYDSLSVSYRSHRYECESDSLVLRKSEEAYRSQPYFDGPYETAFVIWKIRGGAPAQETAAKSVTVPFVLDHNRMLVDVEIQRADGTWRTARLWVDTGEPRFSMSEALARDLGIDLSAISSNPMVPPPAHVRIGGMPLDFSGIETIVGGGPAWMFNTMHNDGHLSSRVLQRYQIVFDYPARLLTIAAPGTFQHRGARAPASVNPETGIVQIDAVIDGDSLSFALDMGASYSFVDSAVVARLLKRHPGLPRMIGAVGCANMWGWWPPDEQSATVVRVPEIVWGPVRLAGVGVVGVPAVAPGGPPLGAWYSRKTAHPVNGFLGPNAFKAFRVEIDYAGGAVYFEKTAELDTFDMDLVGLTLRPEDDGSYSVLGVASKDGKPAVEGVEPGDRLIGIGDLKPTGATMGTVVDALRGKPGDIRYLILERGGNRFRIEAKVARLL